MNSVTGPRLAATLARRGGIGVLPQDMHLQDLDAAIRWVKAQPVVFDTPYTMSPTDTVEVALTRLPAVEGQGIVLHEASGEYVGCLSAQRLATAPRDALLGDLLHGRLASLDADDIDGPRAAFDLLVAADLDFAPVLHQGHVVGTLSRKGALRSTLYRPAVDRGGRLVVGAAVGINGDVRAKAKALAAAGVDVLVLDTAHGHQDAMTRAIADVASLGLGLPIVAGNVVTADAVRHLVGAGASIVKVGVGPGAMCTAGTIEAPGELVVDERGAVYKESWGMASTKAVQSRFERLDPYELTRKTLFAEGISSSKIYLDPLRPSVEDLLDMITSGVRSSFTYAGARTLPEFAERALVGIQSAAGYEEGKPLPVSW